MPFMRFAGLELSETGLVIPDILSRTSDDTGYEHSLEHLIGLHLLVERESQEVQVRAVAS